MIETLHGHTRLLFKHISITGDLYRWLESYLSDHQQQVIIEDQIHVPAGAEPESLAEGVQL